MAHLITGYAGEEHIQSKDQGSFNAAFFGKGQYVMQIGSELEASITSNNNVRIFDGDLLMYGRHIRIEPDTYEDVLIETGTAGMNRNDLIVMLYEKNSSTGIEIAKVEVIRGSETEETPADPTHIDGDILEGAIINQMPLYRVIVEGVVLLELVPLFEKIPTYAMLAEKYNEEFKEACETHLDSLNILDTLEEVNANTESNQLAGALAVREFFQEVKRISTFSILTTEWDDKTTYFSVEKSFVNIKVADRPMMSMISSDMKAPTDAEKENEKLLLGLEVVEDGKVTIYAKEIPSEQITVEVRL